MSDQIKENWPGCGIQCIAEVTKIPAKDIRAMATGDFVSHVEVVRILKSLKYKVKTPFRSTILENRKYIVTVPSLNNVGEFHFVVMWYGEGVEVFDPVRCESKRRYVSVNKKNLLPNEFNVLAWGAVIEISD